MGIFDIDPVTLGQSPDVIRSEMVVNILKRGWKPVHVEREDPWWCPVCKVSGPHRVTELYRNDRGVLGDETADHTICRNCTAEAFTVHEDFCSARIVLIRPDPPKPKSLFSRIYDLIWSGRR